MGKDTVISPGALYGISIVLSFVAWGTLTAWYIWPALRSEPRIRALRPLLHLHSFRFVGAAFLVPGVVSPDLPVDFALPAAYGDLVTSVLAVLALVALESRLGIVLVWICNLWGTADLVYAFYQGNRTGLGDVPGQLAAAYFIPTVLVPLLLIAHGLAFRLLTQGDRRTTPDGPA
jgi:hypothetical protein